MSDSGSKPTENTAADGISHIVDHSCNEPETPGQGISQSDTGSSKEQVDQLVAEVGSSQSHRACDVLVAPVGTNDSSSTNTSPSPTWYQQTPHSGNDTPASYLHTPTGNETPYTASSQELTPSPSYRQQDDVVDEICQNPEPPTELAELIDADNIGGTVFSKHWLFTTLMRLLQVVENDQESKDAKDGKDSTTSIDQCVDLDDALQDNLCRLWDMSMNPEVVVFLMDFKAIDLLSGVIAKSRAPRATEICVGILGNMACHSDVCHEINKNKRLIELVLLLLETPDAPTLIEAMRLLQVCMSDGQSTTCITAIKEMSHVFTSVLFILQSSTNCVLLKKTAEFVDKIMEIDEELCLQWSGADLVLAVMEAVKQTGFADVSVLETFIHLLQLVSTSETGVQALVSYAGEVCTLTMRHLVDVCTDDIVAVTGRENALSSTLSVLSVVFTTWSQHRSILISDFQLVRCVCKIVEAVYPRLTHRPVVPLTPRRRTLSHLDTTSSESLSPDGHCDTETVTVPHSSAEHGDTENRLSALENQQCADSEQIEIKDKQDEVKKTEVTSLPAEEWGDTESKDKVGKQVDSESEGDEVYNVKMVEMLFEVIQNFLTDLMPILDLLPWQPSEEGSMKCDWTAEGAGKVTAAIPKSLVYLNTLCDRRRLECLIHSLDSVAGKHLVAKLHSIADRYSLDRLLRIISQTVR